MDLEEIFQNLKETHFANLPDDSHQYQKIATFFKGKIFGRSAIYYKYTNMR